MIRRAFVAILIPWLALSCSSGQETGPSAETNRFGWRTTGLNPNSDSVSQWGTGIIEVTHSGSRLFAMNAKVADQVETFRKDYRMFTAMQGDSNWTEFWLPNRVSPYAWYANDKYLYVGTDRTSELWRLDVATDQWTNMDLYPDSVLRVFCIREFQGRLLVSLGSGDSARNRVLLQDEAGQWVNINSKFELPEPFHNAVELNGLLYVATYSYGVWTWNPANSSWTRLTDPPDDVKGSAINPRGFVVHNQELYVGYWNGGGIHRYKGSGVWEKVDSTYSDSNGTLKSKIALDVYSLYSNGTHLFSAGYYHSIPTLYTAPKEPQGWRIVSHDTYCPPDSFMCLGTSTHSMTVVNDTLYSASWNRLLKFPLSDLDSGVADALPYPGMSSFSTKKP